MIKAIEGHRGMRGKEGGHRQQRPNLEAVSWIVLTLVHLGGTGFDELI